MTEGTEAVGITEATGAVGVTEATDAEGWSGARGAGATDADALRLSRSMKCVYDGRTDENHIFV